MAASNQYVTYASALVPATAQMTPTGIKLLLPVSGNFQIVEFGSILADGSAASTHVLTLQVQDGAGALVSTGLTLTAAGETDGKIMFRRCDVKVDVTGSKIVVNGVETAVAAGINAVVINATTADADASGLHYLVGCQAGNQALVASSNQVIKTS